MDTREIRCPSGLRGKIRKTLGRDFHNLLIDNPNDATPDQMADLASAVWVETIDPGPYRISPGDAPKFRSEVLIGDRSHILIQSRIFTSGGRRQIRIQCEGCKGWFPDYFDYETMGSRAWPDGDATPVPAGEPGFNAYTARQRFAVGEPCSTKMPDGVVIGWSLLTGSLLAGPIRDYALQFGSTPYSETAARIVSISDMDLTTFAKPEEKRKAIFDRVTEYPDPEFWALWSDIQDHECGPETDVPKQCPLPGCGHQFGYQTDIMGFIMPSPPRRSLRSRAGVQSRKT